MINYLLLEIISLIHLFLLPQEPLSKCHPSLLIYCCKIISCILRLVSKMVGADMITIGVHHYALDIVILHVIN